MRITCLKTNLYIYSGNAYLIRGDKNALEDKNTLIDTGSDGFIINEIETIYTGAGKRAVEQILLTHNHFDHSGGIKFLQLQYSPKIYSFGNCDFSHNVLKDDDMIRVGDSLFQVFHTPGHSGDSVCFYNYDEKILFSGDTQLDIKAPDSTFTEDFLIALERLAQLKINTIYPGHGNPIVNISGCIIKESLQIAQKSKIISI